MIRRVPILLAIFFFASCDSEAPPTAPEAYEAISVVANLNDDPPVFLLLDEDAIGKDLAPNFFDEVDVNEQNADKGVRTHLPFFADPSEDRTITLHSGPMGDEGWFALKTVPGSWLPLGPTDNGLKNFLMAGPGLGSGDDPEALLDKIPDVTPLRATGLKLLEGRAVCAVVYKGDIGINYDPLDGSLKGDNLGIVAFKVLSLTRLSESESPSSLPEVEIEILNADGECAKELTLLEDAPEPESSSELFDVRPPCSIGAPVIDCDVVRIRSNQGGTAVVFADPGGATQTLAAILTIDPDDVEGDVDEFVLTLLHVETPPAPFGVIPEEDQVPFFIEITALDLDDNPVSLSFLTGAEFLLCQPPDLGDPELHKFLKIFQVPDVGPTEILVTFEDDLDICPGEAHGGLRTRVRRFSEFGATFVGPDLEITQLDIAPLGDGAPDEGDDLTYSVTVRNFGGDPSSLRSSTPDHFEVRKVSTNGGIRWHARWINISSALGNEFIGLEPIGPALWQVYFGPTTLGWFDEELFVIFDTHGNTGCNPIC